MINRIMLLFSLCAILISCKKSDNDGCNYSASSLVVPTSEMANLQTYVAAANPAAILHPGGFYYDITTTGSGTVTPVLCSAVSVKYAGYLASGFKFDEATTPVTFTLGGLILGWQRGIPLIKAGGAITLYLPPSLGYGSTAAGSIPPNSITIFTIELAQVQ